MSPESNSSGEEGDDVLTDAESFSDDEADSDFTDSSTVLSVSSDQVDGWSIHSQFFPAPRVSLHGIRC